MTRKHSYKETILHVDMDCFFVSVERLFDPTLHGVPVVTGHDERRGVVSSASYEARALGVHSAMPIVTAKRIIPHLKIVSNHSDQYSVYSKKMFTILEQYTPYVEPVSIDEAYLDISQATNMFGTPKTIATAIKNTVETQLSLPISIGIATNKLLAKLASNEAKPNGIYQIDHDKIDQHLLPLPIGKLHGIGPKMVEKFARYRIRTVQDARNISQDTYIRLLGEKSADNVYQMIWGNDPRPIEHNRPKQKSISKEHTYLEDIEDQTVVKQTLLAISETLSRELRNQKLRTWTVTIKIRFGNFSTITRSHTLEQSVHDSTTIYQQAVTLLTNLSLQRVRIRLVGINLSNLEPASTPQQLRLENDDRWQQLDFAADKARGKFGDSKITRGTLIQSQKIDDTTSNEQQKRL